ncbi:ABC transporter ATP-binding protein [Aminipila butyrica]|uniref:ABC transporter ATP-binding protein n=1 Tax=Aminipila butyrica TaxID=433296 RepID=A0A858BZ19_9FIRM|nr:ABC transporter ATP-binding protein [Aminipila butyrica]QIB69316.1 ABC transporter ATP-binding protein [Aminipila butyrica]
MTAIYVNDLVKKYKSGVVALNGLTLTVREGEIFSLLGENGAGKSTLINILTTYLSPTSGTVTLFGKDTYGKAAEIRSKISCVAQRTSIDTHLSLTENMMFQSKLYKVPKSEAVNRMEMLISCFGLDKYLNDSVSTYSGGVKRRLDIALNLMSKPNVLFLDEPTVGMDIQSRMAMWDMVKKIRNNFGTTIFLTTHYLEEADQLSDTICIMKNGKEVIQGSPNLLREHLRQDMLQISFSGKKEAENYFKALKGALALKESDLRQNKILTSLKRGQSDLEKTIRLLLEHGIPFLGIEIIQPTLEDVFISLTSENRKEVS